MRTSQAFIIIIIIIVMGEYHYRCYTRTREGKSILHYNVWRVTHHINATATKLTSRRAAVIKRHIVSVPVETNFARSTFSSSTRRNSRERERKELNRTGWTGKKDRGFPRWYFTYKSGRRPVWKMDNWFSSRIRITILHALQRYLQIIILLSITIDYCIGIFFYFFLLGSKPHSKERALAFDIALRSKESTNR